MLGQVRQAEQLREEALGKHRTKVEGKLVPWYEPLGIMVKSAKRSKEGVGEGLRSAMARAEGGWRSQLHLCAVVAAEHPYCTECGPLNDVQEEDGAGSGAERRSWEEKDDVGIRLEWEHIDWGGQIRRWSCKRDAEKAR